MNSTLLSLAFVLLGVAATLSAPIGRGQGGRRGRRPETKDEQMNYLRKFGHWRGPKNISNATDEDMRRSLKALQRFAGIPNTGVVDNDTMEVMISPRCGLGDDDDAPGRRKRYVLFGTKWFSNIFSYFFENVTPDLSTDVAKADIARAFKYWADVTPLSFTESNKSSSILSILFASGNHGDNSPFDGLGGVLAHAYFPRAGKAHFDEDELWTHGTSQGTNLEQVATHEFGHLLGLSHSPVKTSVMFPYYTYKRNFALDTDDITGIQAIYGKPPAVSPPTALPTVRVPLPSIAFGSTTPGALTAKPTARPTTIPTTKTTTTTTTTKPTNKPTTRITTTTKRPRRCRFYESWFGWC